jgi:trehalose utilization protein
MHGTIADALNRDRRDHRQHRHVMQDPDHGMTPKSWRKPTC